MTTMASGHAALVLDPQYTGSFSTGVGARATFVQIDSTWHGSTVLWNEGSRSYGSGVAIGQHAWGTGLWGRADLDTVQAAASGSGGRGSPELLGQWSGLVPTINFANALYNDRYAGTWGAASLVPLFSPADHPEQQQNWTAMFSGFVRISDPGAYNFSVLNDDGFYFRLTGANGQTASIGRDFLNPRERNGFDEDLLLDVGLYGFELGFWNRLEAGVVDLRWQRPGDSRWTLVPTEHFSPTADVDQPRPIPAPPSLALAALGLLLLSAGRLRSARSAIVEA